VVDHGALPVVEPATGATVAEPQLVDPGRPSLSSCREIVFE